MKKIVINRCHGGFGLSHAAILRYFEIEGSKLEVTSHENSFAEHTYKKNDKDFWDWQLQRDDSILVQVVEEMGKVANDSYSDLAIVEIPDDVQWVIEEYDGAEWVSEVHRKWY
jgi:hypothetical protein